MKTLAIIGTAGRGDDAKRLSLELYDRMIAVTRETIAEWGITGAISGGAAVADHLAVIAYLEGWVEHLDLRLPAEFRNGQFVPNPGIQFNPGRTCNNYHRQFSAWLGRDSLADIERAIAKGAEVHVHPGFHNRNLEVAARCQAMLAFTFGSVDKVQEMSAGGGDEIFHQGSASDIGRLKSFDDFGPDDGGFLDSRMGGLRDGGTAHTWTQCWKADVKRHVNLFRLQHELLNRTATSPTLK